MAEQGIEEPAALRPPVVVGTARQVDWLLNFEEPPKPAAAADRNLASLIYQEIGTAGLLDQAKYTAAREALQELAKEGSDSPELSPDKPSPPPVDYPKEGTVVIIPCSKLKSKLPVAPAEQMYTGDYFKSNLAYARAHGAEVFILSAKYGLITPEQDITTYDVSFVTTPGESVKAEKLVKQIKEHGLDKMDRWVVLGGQESAGLSARRRR